jgi:TPR repeat protein
LPDFEAQIMTADELFDRANQEWDSGHLREAFALFLQAAEMGYASAQNSVGYFYDHGHGMAKDHVKAVFWYRRAARGGDVCGYHNLAIVHRDAGNLRRARFWLAKVLSRGRDGEAFLELAKLCLSRRRPNAAQAREYLTRAVRTKYITPAGREEAQALLAKLRAAAVPHSAGARAWSAPSISAAPRRARNRRRTTA